MRVVVSSLSLFLCLSSSVVNGSYYHKLYEQLKGGGSTNSNSVVDEPKANNDNSEGKSDGVIRKVPPRSVGEFEDEIDFFQSIGVTDNSPIYTTKSKYQEIAVHESVSYFGKILVLDDVIQLTERDANAYNEMLAHIPMFHHPNPKRVLIIGGGDGYVLHEVLKHPSVEHVDHVDLDEEVIKTCEKYFSWGDAWKDKRVKLHIADGAAFVEEAEPGSYDVIIQDSSDPWTTDDKDQRVKLPSSVLYEDEHFQNIFRVLKPNGVFNMQAERFQIPSELEAVAVWRNKLLDLGFTRSRYGTLYISSYPTGQIGFLLCEKEEKQEQKVSDQPIFENMKDIRTRHALIQKQKDAQTTYYHPGLQQSSFDLPLFVQNAIYGEDSPPMACINNDSISSS